MYILPDWGVLPDWGFVHIGALLSLWNLLWECPYAGLSFVFLAILEQSSPFEKRHN